MIKNCIAYKYFIKLIIILLFSISSQNYVAQAYDGFTLFNPVNSKNTYLLDMSNDIVHTWNNSRNGGYSVYLLENGNILRPCEASNTFFFGGGSAGLVQEIDKDGIVVWQFEYSSQNYLSHHDIEPLPNGNLLLIAWELKTGAEAIEAGRSQDREMWPDHIIEIEPVGSSGGNIVWEWHVWDHLIQDYDPTKNNFGVIGDHPELIDINLNPFFGPMGGDWLHVNGIDYNPDLDQIIFSSHFMDEIYVIDHSTTTAEAAGHTGGNSGMGGDILYRWGRPGNYDAPGIPAFDVVHCAVWVPNDFPGGGNIMAFNNGESQFYSEIIEITPPVDVNGNYSITPGTAFEPQTPTWLYSNGSTFYSNHLGSCQRLPNGNTLISESTSGYLFEVTSDGSVVWSYDYGGQIARSLRYDPLYPGLSEIVPVELINFYGIYDGKSVFLKWKTSTETNNKGFEIEKSVFINASSDLQNSDWKKIAFLEGGGTTSFSQDYTFIDDEIIPSATMNYRLKQIDFSGTFEYSKVVEVTTVDSKFRLYQNYPNPFNPSTKIQFSVPAISSDYKNPVSTNLKIFDVLGNEIITLIEEDLLPGNYEVDFNISEFTALKKKISSGTYFYRLIAGDNSATKKMLLIR